MPTLINTVYQSLLSLGKPQPEPRNPAVQIRRSVTRNYVVCLECGWQVAYAASAYPGEARLEP
jgi:predicted transcriptional regulator